MWGSPPQPEPVAPFDLTTHPACEAPISKDVRQVSLFHTHVRGKQDIKGNFIFGSLEPITSSLFILFIYLIGCCCRSELTGT